MEYHWHSTGETALERSKTVERLVCLEINQLKHNEAIRLITLSRFWQRLPSNGGAIDSISLNHRITPLKTGAVSINHVTSL